MPRAPVPTPAGFITIQCDTRETFVRASAITAIQAPSHASSPPKYTRVFTTGGVEDGLCFFSESKFADIVAQISACEETRNG